MKNSKQIVLLLVVCIVSICFFCSFVSNSNKKDCEDVKSYAESAYSYFRKAYFASSLDDVQYYAKRGMNEASSAEDEADESDCDCDDAESSADDAYSYGKKSYYSDNLEDAQYYAKKAMNSSSEISEEADDCEDEE